MMGEFLKTQGSNLRIHAVAIFIFSIIQTIRQLSSDSRDRIVVSTSRCGRDNPGSNPGHGISCECRRHGTAELFFLSFLDFFFFF